MRMRKGFARVIVALAIVATCAGRAQASGTATPIEHIVVIFQENVSFDHYFGTYPVAANNTPGEPKFQAAPNTPGVNGLLNGGLLNNNPNTANPFRLGRAQSATCDQDHAYTDELEIFDLGLMDKFVQFNAGCNPNQGHPNDLIMGYFDGNTVTALWNYAQFYAMSDNSFGTTFGPSTPGVLNLIAGNTNGASPPNLNTAFGPDTVSGSVVSDPQPTGDVCTTRDNVTMSGSNIGDLLNSAHVTWGNIAGGFDLTIQNPNLTTGCHRSHTSVTGAFPPKVDYIPHHEGFQYFASTANLQHLRPCSIAVIGHDDGGVHHQYDLHDFFDALNHNNFPAVSFLKADGYQDGHAGYSSPLDEQTFIANTVNFLLQRPEWPNTLVIIAYDDSDGWYDHQMSTIVSQSITSADTVGGVNLCGTKNTDGIAGRCGYGPRLPLIAISPFAKPNFVDHTLTDQSSILKFIADNWGLNLGQLPNSMAQIAGPLTNMLDFSTEVAESVRLFIDPTTGKRAFNH
ncbi:MAG TPA: alkaline phosphatase family protein, partial [Candidatus Acidoferrales bacterium]|nr:alkaline phosphatase family protein [Candidatus Acidoferrales bacterium]